MFKSLILFLLGISLFTGCSKNKSVATTPLQAYNRWKAAWDEHDGAVIKDLTASVHSKNTTPEYWSNLSGRNLRKSEPPAKDTDNVTIKLDYSSEWNEFSWYNNSFDRFPFFIYNRRTPANTVKSLIMAIKMQRWKMIKELLIEEVRFKLSDEQIKKMFSYSLNKGMILFIKQISDALKTPFIVYGNFAKLLYDKDKTITLQRIASNWYIVTLE